MSVLKSKRKPSQFEVFHHLNKMRKEVTDLLLRDFGYDLDKAVKKVETTFGGRPYEELSPDEKVRYEKLMEKNTAFAEWFIADERKVIVDCLRNITEEVYVANSIYPTYREELIERRVHQDRAVGQCYRLTQELQYAIETLPVDVNKYLRFAEMIQTEINPSLKVGESLTTSSSRLSKRVISDSASNFANVNNNGNANYNNASNSNGVRPDFDSVIE